MAVPEVLAACTTLGATTTRFLPTEVIVATRGPDVSSDRLAHRFPAWEVVPSAPVVLNPARSRGMSWTDTWYAPGTTATTALPAASWRAVAISLTARTKITVCTPPAGPDC